MHILITRGLSGDFLGGAETEILDFSGELKRLGHKVSLITNSSQLSELCSSNMYTIELIDWPLFTGRGPKRIASINKFKRELTKNVNTIKPDLVFSQSRDDLNALAGDKKINTQLFYRDHSDLRHHLLPNRKSKLARHYQARLVKSLHLTEGIFTNSPFEVPIIQEYVDKDIYVMPSGINFNYKPPARNFEKKVLTYGAVARLVESKGVQYFIEALKLIQDSDLRQIKAVVYGDGDYKNELIKKARMLNVDIDFRGYDPDMRRVCKNIDVLVQTSEYDGWSRVVSDAMYSGCAIIASDIPSQKRQLANNSGILFKSKDPKDLAKKISESIKNRESLNQFSINAKSRVVKTTHISVTTNIFLNKIKKQAVK